MRLALGLLAAAALAACSVEVDATLQGPLRDHCRGLFSVSHTAADSLNVMREANGNGVTCAAVVGYELRTRKAGR